MESSPFFAEKGLAALYDHRHKWSLFAETRAIAGELAETGRILKKSVATLAHSNADHWAASTGLRDTVRRLEAMNRAELAEPLHDIRLAYDEIVSTRQ
jgi:hypothetical protein